MSKKYELVESSKIILKNVILYRIKALVDIPNIVKAGELGGYIESEENLSHEGNCWVGDDAYVYNNAYIYIWKCKSIWKCTSIWKGTSIKKEKSRERCIDIK